MPKAIRQENLYGAEDWSLIYSSFRNAEFISYDFDTLRDSMINYMQINYPEEFNDYIQNSEFIALLDLVAYVGQNLAFRMDLNARENILDTAEKRESVLRIARMLSYKPKRVRPAQGFLKIVSVTTSEQLLDSTGANLSNKTVLWGSDPSELEYDRFIRILNSAFSDNNKFGNPVKRTVNNTTGNIFEVYDFDNSDLFVNYPIAVNVDGSSLNFDIVPLDINTDGYLTQTMPDYENKFSILYRNDGKGVGSTRTGFFVMAKQGYINNTVQYVDNQVSNFIIDIDSSANISEDDFYVQTVDETGSIIKTWTRIANIGFNNIVLNEYGQTDKNLYEVIYSDSNVTSIKFGDGTFGNMPAGFIRVWYRLAEDSFVTVKSGEITNVAMDITYVNADNQRNILTMVLELQDNMVTGLPAETLDEIKQNAPEAFYSKNRMVTADDYNGFLPTLNNDVLIMKAENRTFSGHTRYVDLRDPTGKSRPLVEFADDGYIYKEESAKSISIPDDLTRRTVDLLDEYIEKQLGDLGLLNFYYGKLNLTNVTGEESLLYFNPIDLDKTIYYTTIVSDMASSQHGDYGFTLNVASINTADPYDSFDITGGLLQINDELFTYESVSGSSFTNVKRAAFGSSRQTHSAGDKVYKLYDYRWRVAYSDPTSSNGYISESNSSTKPVKLGFTTAGPLRSIRPGAMIKLLYSSGAEKWITVNDIKGDGLGLENNNFEYTGLLANGHGSVEINSSITEACLIKSIIPGFPRVFDDLTRTLILEKLEAKESFSLRFDNTVPKWTVITKSVFIDAPFEFPFDEAAWLISLERETTGYTMTVRQIDYVFGSEELIRFYNINFLPSFNSDFKMMSDDVVSIISLDSNNNLSTVKSYRVSGYFVYDDGYTDASKVKVTPLDIDNDFLPDNPQHFTNIVGENKLALINYNEGDFSYLVPAELTTPEEIISTVQGKMKLAFKWDHKVPVDQTLNPSLTNIIDVYVLTKTYNDEFVKWKRKNNTSLKAPLPPTTEELASAFKDLRSYKMMTDEVIFHPVKFKPLFGKLSEKEFQAQFKVVKNPRSRLTDSEIKSKVISAIDTFFTPGNFNFGEIFYFTELAAYIHAALSTDLNSVVVVPISTEGRFGKLFQVQPNRDEIVTSTATINDIIVINEITDSNIRIGR